MIKKLFLTFSFIALATFAFSETTYAAQEGETLVISEELTKLNNLYKEGVITEEEFSKAKSILLNPDSGKSKKKKKRKKINTLVDLMPSAGTTAAERKRLKEQGENVDLMPSSTKGTTAAERKRLKDQKEEELKALKEQLREERKAERERIKQASLEEKKRIIEAREKACKEDPKGKACRKAKLKLSNILEKLKIMSLEAREKQKKESELEKQVIKERKEILQKERELKKQANLEERERIKAEKALRKAERKKLKAEWKKACSEDPESKACKEGKPSEKIKNVLKKIEKKLGG